MDRFFKLKENGTNVRTEIVAGLTTFMTMAYILFVNTLFLGSAGAGMSDNAVFFATAVGAGLMTIIMGLFVNIPIALAPGMGLNAYFMTVVLSSNGAISWQAALGAVFISGIVFIILTVTKIRQMLLVAVPDSLKMAITVGIGLFITIVGFKLANLVAVTVNVAPDADLSQPIPGSSFNLSLGNFITHHDALLALIGLLIIAVLMVMRVKGALLIGIIATTLIGIPMGVTNLSGLSGASWLPNFSDLAVGQLDLKGAISLGLFEIIFIFTFVELFDTFGTMVGTATRMGIMKDKKKGEKTIGKAMLVDAVGVSAGAALGTSTITAFVESASGVEAGGRTGLTSVTTGILFILALFIAPLALVVPSAATAPALIIVGVLMMNQVRSIEWDDFLQAFPAFLTIVLMPFTGGIANGISAGIVSYVILAVFSNLVTDRKVKIHWLMWILAIIVICRYVFIGGE
ncbi:MULTISPECIES: NCS2 family permease [unclassified Paenibacillus]|uniref:NCS2 family permease n=1 Tax=Paenibacillus TaxID=44249 RepID=UPI0007E4502E|nr:MULTISPECIES: NCS2 family permease [unclassified Paenibacillus]OAX45089.1 Adenine permease AdeQ [Paenibacillus sp. AD87]SEL14122.1 putative MFS transporter, AGZA family, xanthine/uracil permease [Paenibacillus sp. OK003]SLK07552.1 putative MFS transporter, AGZA family, xanthine/uracil permease [Paenibacillus sp. RU5A]SOC70761.1 putative MFS transporter, AGZA family, xanthine/uracil permease [Paenibacillus sp. RU26A]SOC73088.1 putative MFS transporter, AGZA family, xanthine/uracil permease [